MKRRRLSAVPPARSPEKGPDAPGPDEAAVATDGSTATDAVLAIQVDLPAGVPFAPDPTPRISYLRRPAA